MVYEYFAEKSEYCLLPTVEGLKWIIMEFYISVQS